MANLRLRARLLCNMDYAQCIRTISDTLPLTASSIARDILG